MIQFNFKDLFFFCQQCFINGQWCDVEDGVIIDVDNFFNGDIIGIVLCMKEVDIL